MRSLKQEINLLSIFSEDKQLITYRPIWNKMTGSVTATILLQQIIYWDQIMGGDFYKFKEGCNHEDYIEGQSWCEELGLTRSEFDSALKKIAIKKASIRDLRKASDEEKEVLQQNEAKALVLYWTSNDRKTYYRLNREVMEHEITKLYVNPDHDLRKKRGLNEPKNGSNSNKNSESVDVNPNSDLRKEGIPLDVNRNPAVDIYRSETTTETTSSSNLTKSMIEQRATEIFGEEREEEKVSQEVLEKPQHQAPPQAPPVESSTREKPKEETPTARAFKNLQLDTQSKYLDYERSHRGYVEYCYQKTLQAEINLSENGTPTKSFSNLFFHQLKNSEEEYKRLPKNENGVALHPPIKTAQQREQENLATTTQTLNTYTQQRENAQKEQQQRALAEEQYNNLSEEERERIEKKALMACNPFEKTQRSIVRYKSITIFIEEQNIQRVEAA